MQETKDHGDRWFKEAEKQAKVSETIQAIKAATRALGTPLGETGRFTDGALTPDDEGDSDSLSPPAAARSSLRSPHRLSGSGCFPGRPKSSLTRSTNGPRRRER
jgi:hypothetical protein